MSFDDFDEEELEDGDESKWVLFELNERWFAVNIEHVRELIVAPEMIELPDAPPFLIGLTKLRESTIPVIDLRLRLGMPSMKETRQRLIDTLKARKQDHLSWLDELKASVEEHREFTKQTDPHKCEFGMWYDSFKTDDLVLSGLLKKFDAPHKAIHGIAVKVKRLEGEGRIDEARAIIKDTEKRELKMMVDLFDSVIAELGQNSRQVALIAELDGFVCGMLVDRIETVITLDPDEISPPPKVSAARSSDKLLGVARPKASDKVILLLDPRRVVDSEEMESLLG